jgi:site-specific recombinase XerD
MKQLPNVCQDFINYMKSKRSSDNTIRSYSFDLKDFVKNVENFQTATVNDIRNYINTLDSSKSTINRKIATLKSFYNYMAIIGTVKENPMLQIKGVYIQKKIPDYLNADETVELIDSIDINSRNYYRDFAIITIFANTGLRRFELCNIKLDDIKGKILHVQGKGDKHRKIPLNDDCIEAINDYLAVRKDESKYLFLSERKQKISEITVAALTKKHLKNIGKGNLSTHRLRHSFASRLVKNDVNIIKIKDLLGHGQIETTMLYAHSDIDGLMEAVNSSSLRKHKNKNNS